MINKKFIVSIVIFALVFGFYEFNKNDEANVRKEAEQAIKNQVGLESNIPSSLFPKLPSVNGHVARIKKIIVSPKYVLDIQLVGDFYETREEMLVHMGEAVYKISEDIDDIQIFYRLQRSIGDRLVNLIKISWYVPSSNHDHILTKTITGRVEIPRDSDELRLRKKEKIDVEKELNKNDWLNSEILTLVTKKISTKDEIVRLR